MATEKQIELIRSLSHRILAVDVNALPSKAKAAAGFTFNHQQNGRAAQTIAKELLGRLETEELSVGTACAWISDLQMQARRARA